MDLRFEQKSKTNECFIYRYFTDIYFWVTCNDLNFFNGYLIQLRW